jgi:hypothetical protein
VDGGSIRYSKVVRQSNGSLTSAPARRDAAEKLCNLYK